MAKMITVDVMGRRGPIKEFFSSNDLKIWLLHDSVELLPKMASFGALSERTVLYFSSSWFVSERRAKRFRLWLQQAQEAVGASMDVSRNVVFLANSRSEETTLRKALPAGTGVILVNNTCFLDTDIFDIFPGCEKKWLCVINAKPFAFKRLELSGLVPDKIFITYMRDTPDRYGSARVSLPDLNPSAIFRNIADGQVAVHLNQSKVGAILSEEEGACYASTEYLLCGLPVVSTPSRGGRDVFYDDTTAVICQPDAGDVVRAVRHAAERVGRGEITAAEIRRRTVERIGGFRENLIGSLRQVGHRFGLDIDFRSYLQSCLDARNKMADHRNLFLTDIELS